MSTTTIWQSNQGPLAAVYQYNASKGKDQLKEITSELGAISFSNIWVNEAPASYLQGFKFFTLAQEDQVTLKQTTLEIRTNQFAHLTFKIQSFDENSPPREIAVPEKLKVMGFKEMIRRKYQIDPSIHFNITFENRALDELNLLEDFDLENGTELVLKALQKKACPRQTISDLEKLPPSVENYSEIGLSFYNQGNFEKAISYYKKAIEFQESQLATSYNNLAAALLSAGKSKEAQLYDK